DDNFEGFAGVTVDLAAGTAIDGFGATDTLTNIENVRGTDFGDTITGDGANNVLEGKDGDDTLSGGAGNDTIDGGLGSADRAVFAGNFADYTVTDNGGGSVTVTDNVGTDGTDQLQDVEFLQFADLVANPGLLAGTAIITGTSGNDTLNGTAGNEIFVASTGSDIVASGGGTDTLLVELGLIIETAVVDTTSGDLTVILADGNDDLSQTVIENHLANPFTSVVADLDEDGELDIFQVASTFTAATSENTVIVGSDDVGGETISGNSGDDLLYGNAGNDVLNGNSGDDFIFGGAGSDIIDGGAGFDGAVYSEGPETVGVTVNLSTGTAIDTFGDTDTLINIESVFGTDQVDNITIGLAGVSTSANGYFGDDILIGTDGTNGRFSGGEGNDTITGGDFTNLFKAQRDTVDYSEDILDGGTAGVNVNLAAGTAIDGFGNTDTLSGLERVIGTIQDDVIVGSDTTVNGSAFNNTERFAGLAGNDSIDGGLGNNVVDYSQDEKFGGFQAVTVDLAAGTAIDGFGDTDTLTNIERVRGTSHDDVFTAGGGGQQFIGLGGSDTIDGGSGGSDEVRYDVDASFGGTAGVNVNLATGVAIDGFGTTDSLSGIERARGTSEDDTLIGNASNNRFRGLDGNDTIDGGAGTGDEVDYVQDFNKGGTQDVTVDLSAGTAIDGFGGVDTLSNIENIRAGVFDDTLTGDANANRFIGLAGNDTIDGGDGIDQVDYSQDSVFGGIVGVTVDLSAGTATDGFGSTDSLTNIESVTGTEFADNITGDIGSDTLTGGLGSDIFRYTAADQSATGASDLIADFIADTASSDHDVISLEGVVSGAFSFVGDETTAFSGGGNASAKFNDTTKILEIDVDGNLTTDMEIELTNVALADLDDTDFSVS
ncbi:MAG: calcium-binding protein, partial [Rhodospirillaceae bacterium]|nr:calcium-binding protein [Rhodospirillaceae bacterium]